MSKLLEKAKELILKYKVVVIIIIAIILLGVLKMCGTYSNEITTSSSIGCHDAERGYKCK